ncbi:sugar phosphate isomerase/epimerase family protein [Halocatena salina]|uniref:Sugar phosphate isomerase/epimerase n=1 Tax=Halocatena salina TaxID=2934340 RepID=A0A8U0A5K1_9EURY|nr:sugar phosphate isomerase/epimerase family protein [Halocatena salina]UPM44314.1 sugar phosphate isomerase/epimerase [Halocatena salina]
MQFGFSTNAFRGHSLEATIETLADAGYDGIEILLDTPHLYPGDADRADVRQVRKLLDAHDLAISNCNAFMLSAIERSETSHQADYPHETAAFHHPSFIEPDATDRRARIEHTQAALETAAALGASRISIQPGGPVPVDKSDERAVEEFVDGLQTVAATAETVGIDVLIEPEPELLVETSEQFLDLVDRIDSPRVGCNFDAGHFYASGEDPVALIDVLAEYTCHYHLEDIPADRTHDHTQLGEGAMDIDGFLGALSDSGYDGFVTVELYPYEATAPETARGAMEYLEDHGWV